MQYAKTIFKTLTGAITGTLDGEEAWVDTDESLTPREKLVRQVASIMQWGSIVNLLVLLVLNILLAFDVVVADTMGNWLFSGWIGTTGEMTLLGFVCNRSECRGTASALSIDRRTGISGMVALDRDDCSERTGTLFLSLLSGAYRIDSGRNRGIFHVQGLACLPPECRQCTGITG